MRAELQSADVVGSYRIDQEIASGGMGIVYRAEHLFLPRKAAIKVMHPNLLNTQSAVERMLQEARILEAMDHPTVVKIYDAGRLHDGRPWVAMELLDGVSLSDHLFVHGQVRPREAILVVRVVASALMRAHSSGVIHRDVKPENIMLVPGANGLTVKLIDWGIAHVDTDGRSRRLTQHDYSPGTPCYMSPEQLRGHAVDGRADTYALGVVAYEMLNGHPPFDAPHPLEIAMKTLHDRIPSLNPELDLPPSIEKLIAGMLAKEPGDRPSLDTVCAAFSAWLAEPEDDYEEFSLEVEMDAEPECVFGEISCPA